MSDDVEIAPLGRYHPAEHCWRCGASAWDGVLRYIVVRATRARAAECADTVACERRYNHGRQLQLFGDVDDAGEPAPRSYDDVGQGERLRALRQRRA